jgi:hypothetical protein
MNEKLVVLTYNPEQFPPVHVVQTEGLRTASTAVQFNIDHPSIGGTVFVDEANHGVCRFTLPTGSKAASQPQWRAYSEDPPGAFGKLTISASTGVENGSEVVTFDVQRGTNSKASTVTILFTVDYK